jgi:hypothetical protein
MNTNLAHYYFRTSLVVLAAACLLGCAGGLGRYHYDNHGVRASITVGGGGQAPSGLTELGCSGAAWDAAPGKPNTAFASCGPASSTLISIKFEFTPAK